MVGIVIAIVNFEIDMKKIEKEGDISEVEREESRREANVNYFLRWLIFTSSILALICLFLRQHYKNEWFKIFRNH